VTLQTKYLLELSDILALRVECTYCKATVSLSMDRDIEVKKLRCCPNCSHPWTTHPQGPTIEVGVEELIRALKKMIPYTNNQAAFPIECSLTLEIKADALTGED